MVRCPSDIELDRYHGEELPDGESEAVRRHLAECSSCADRDAGMIAECAELVAAMRRLPAGRREESFEFQV